MKFARLFDSSKYGQVLAYIQKDEEDEDYWSTCIRFYYEDAEVKLTIGGINDFNKACENLSSMDEKELITGLEKLGT